MMIRLELTIEQVDYGALIQRFLPILRGSGHPLGAMPAEMVKRWAAALPTERKEQLAAELLNANREALLEAASAALGRQGIPLRLGGGRASVVK
ncbi:MAG: hypothetical protein LUE61_08990 [Clostridiales bacterium]|nr:hypothetical protein [Clostridiales bacterium]